MKKRAGDFGAARKPRRFWLWAAGAAIFVVLAVLGRFAYRLYPLPAARVEAVSAAAQGQTVRARVLDGKFRGARVALQNACTRNGAQGVRLRRSDTIFVNLKNGAGGLSATFAGFAYDAVLLPFLLLFALLLLLVGGCRGMLALLSAGLNTGLFLLVVRLYDSGWSFLLPAAGAAALSAVVSILLVVGRGRKALAALLATFGSEAFALLLTVAALAAAGSKGMHYDQMEFLTRAPQEVFLAQVLVGTLGGVMDVAVTMASSVQEMLESAPGIAPAKLWRSGMAVSGDILSTMTNTMLFAYFSGSIPLILLWLENGYSVSTVLGINLSLEAVRALAGCIGIVAAVPLSLFVSVRVLARGAGKAVGG